MLRGECMKAKRPGRNKQLEAKFKKHLAEGMKPRAAMKVAGYADSTIHSSMRRTLDRPLIKSALTEAAMELLAEEKQEFKDIVRPFVEGLKAPVIVKSQTEGIATIAVDPDTQKVIPDIPTRMDAAKHLVNLFGGFPKESEMPAPPAKGLTVIINRDGPVEVNQDNRSVTVDRTRIEPTGEDTGDTMPKVKFTKG